MVAIVTDLTGLHQLVAEIQKHVLVGMWIFLNGDLGAGKTTFTQTFMAKIGYTKTVSSPTFSILNVLDIDKAQSDIQRVCHLDLYRLKNPNELCHLGLELEFSSHSICMIEWAENVEPSGWLSFFSTTQCRRPKKILEVNIILDRESGQRIYELSWLDTKSVLGV